MGKCRFCGHPAGILMDYHTACKDEYDLAKDAVEKGSKEVVSAVSECLFQPKKHKRIADALANLPEAIGHPKPLDILLGSIDDVIEGIRQSGEPLTAEQCAAYIAFINSQEYSREIADKIGTLRKVALLTIIRELSEGIIPDRCKINVQVPFILQKNEKMILVTEDVELYEQTLKRRYVGKSSGSSIRICSGLWWRTGDSQGTSVSLPVIERVDIGMLAITTKNIFYNSEKKSFKTKLDKIVSLELMADGIRITKDGANAKPQWFVTNDGWFYHKAITLLNQI